jgi:branched-chain amino acid transport system substrate-binding protein
VRSVLVAWLAATLLVSISHAQEPVRIGVLSDMGGPYADAAGAGSVAAVRLAVEDAGGTVLGRPVEVLSADHQNKPDVATAIARHWFDVDGVSLVTDLTNSAVAIAVQALAREKRRIDLVTSTATTALTNEACSPYGAHWTFDSYALAAGTARSLVAAGGRRWYFITADYSYGANMERTASRMVKAAGGEVLGHSLAPLGTTDFAAQLLQAQTSGADVIGLANSGADTANTVAQAAEFGVVKRQKLAAFLPFITDIKAIGLSNAQGLLLTTAFYWDRDDAGRAWAQRFYRLRGAMPTMIQAGTYSAVLHYLHAVADAGTLDPDAVIAAMRRRPVDDAVFHGGSVRADGQMVHPMYLVQVKSPAESHGDWDLYKIVRTIPGDEAFQPLSESTCSLVQHKE